MFRLTTLLSVSFFAAFLMVCDDDPVESALDAGFDVEVVDTSEQVSWPVLPGAKRCFVLFLANWLGEYGLPHDTDVLFAAVQDSNPEGIALDFNTIQPGQCVDIPGADMFAPSLGTRMDIGTTVVQGLPAGDLSLVPVDDSEFYDPSRYFEEGELDPGTQLTLNLLGNSEVSPATYSMEMPSMPALQSLTEVTSGVRVEWSPVENAQVYISVESPSGWSVDGQLEEIETVCIPIEDSHFTIPEFVLSRHEDREWTTVIVNAMSYSTGIPDGLDFGLIGVISGSGWDLERD